VKTILMTQYEVAFVGDGSPMTVGTLEGEEYRVYCPAKIREGAAPDGEMPEVPIWFDQLRTVATGGVAFAFVKNPPGATFDIVEQIAVRLPDLYEWRQLREQAKAWFEAHDQPYLDQPSEESQLWMIEPVTL
jgi:hypothetical protein